MGYYTNYNIETQPPFPGLCISEQYDLVTGEDGACDGEAIKWYDHHEDLLEVSKTFPETLIIVDGSGEENGDVWRKFYKGGKSYCWRAERPSPPSFDESKLK